jgi:hypothetical protein
MNAAGELTSLISFGSMQKTMPFTTRAAGLCGSEAQARRGGEGAEGTCAVPLAGDMGIEI